MGKLRHNTFDERKTFAEVREIYDNAKGRGAFDKLTRADKAATLKALMPKRDELYINNWLAANYPQEPEQGHKEMPQTDAEK